MKMEWNKKYTTIAIYTFITLAAVVFFGFFIHNLNFVSEKLGVFLSLIAPILYGIAIAYILNPMLKFFDKNVTNKLFKKAKPKTKRSWSILFTYLTAFIIVGVMFWIVIPEVGESISSLANKTLTFVKNIDTHIANLENLIPFSNIPDDITHKITETLTEILMNIYDIISSAAPHIVNATVKFSKGIFNFIFGIIIAIYLLSGKEQFIAQTKKILYSFINKNRVDFLIELAHEGNDIFSGFISGKILDSLIIGIICFASMSILKMPSAMLVSLLVGITNVIPYFGPFIGAIPSVLIILMDSPSKALIFIIFILILQQFDGNILGPKILGQSTGLSPFWVIFAILFFGGTLKVLGMFIGVPTFAVIYNIVRRIVNHNLRKKEMSTVTDDYASPDNPILK